MLYLEVKVEVGVGSGAGTGAVRRMIAVLTPPASHTIKMDWPAGQAKELARWRLSTRSFLIIFLSRELLPKLILMTLMKILSFA